MYRDDAETGAEFKDNHSAAPSYSYRASVESNYGHSRFVKENFGQRVFDSFKHDPTLAVTPRGVVGSNGRVFDPEHAAVATATSPLARRLKGRHLQMIAIGGSIGEALVSMSSGCMASSYTF
jgi:amino acid transporter